VARLKKARNGLFTPLSTQETVAVPGAVGGANWGNTAANPAKGIVYVLSQDFPSFYQLSETPPNLGGAAAARPGGAPANAASAAGNERGRTIYEQTCQACHAADRSGTPTGPSLIGLAARMRFDDFKQLVLAGRGHMPAFPSIEDEPMRALYAHAAGVPPGANAGGDAPPVKPDGPVVATGGARGGLEMPRGTQRFDARGGAYPDGIEVPKQRFFTGYGLGFPYIMTGPWSTIQAYDLNKGTVLWKRPLGQDIEATKAGLPDVGMPRGAQRQGMIVTPTGLVFATAKDGHVRAYDADTGDILWTGDLPNGNEGLPAMYEINGRQFLVVCATTGLTWGRASREGGPWTQANGMPPQSAYVVFALPDKKGTR
jgi:quinoprotein glucose dehydrogenase